MPRLPVTLYRWLLKLYPAEFRENYGEPLQQQFRDDYREVQGVRGLLLFWLRTVSDVVRSAPAQFAREVAQDARHTLRLWRRRPLHTGFAIAVLAIAIGANTGVFSVLNAMLLRALPFHEPDRLASLNMFVPARDTFHDWRQRSAYLADAALYDTFEVNLDAASQTTRLRLTETSWNFFAVLGRGPIEGRGFLPGEDVAGRNALAVIGHGLWQQLYGAQPGVIGSTIRVNGTPLTIVGIAPPGLDYPQRTAIWTPSTFDYGLIPKTQSALFWLAIGRLKPGLTWTQAQQAFEAEAYAEDPSRRQADAANRPTLRPLQDQLARPIRSAWLVLMGGVALLLLLACANLAHLLLARTISRSNELAIRTALGASRGRLAQQLLTETVLLSLAATLAGLILAGWIAQFATAVQPAALASQAYRVLDWRVLAFVIGVCLVTGLAFGVGPALYASRSDIATGRATPASRHTRTRSLLIAVQIAVTIVLVTGSIALGRAFVTLLRVDNGFDVRPIVSMSVSLAGAGIDEGAVGDYYRRVTERVRSIPGVTSVSATESLPLDVESYAGSSFNVDRTGTPTLGLTIRVAPGYFSTIGARLIAGREFTADDQVQRGRLVIVNEEFARKFGDPGALVGRQLTSERWPPAQIIGVVRGSRDAGPAHTPPPQVFFSTGAARQLAIVARVSGRARDRIGIIRDAVQSVDRRVPVFNVKTMDERLDTVLAQPRFYTMAAIFFGGLAVLLAVIGVYGIVSYAVVQRMREMGIRLALGATPLRLRAWLLRSTLVTVGIGIAAGIGGAVVFRRYLQSLVHGADAPLLSTTLVAVAFTTLVAAAAIWTATRQVARLDIADVLRAEGAD